MVDIIFNLPSPNFECFRYSIKLSQIKHIKVTKSLIIIHVDKEKFRYSKANDVEKYNKVLSILNSVSICK